MHLQPQAGQQNTRSACLKQVLLDDQPMPTNTGTSFRHTKPLPISPQWLHSEDPEPIAASKFAKLLIELCHNAASSKQLLQCVDSTGYTTFPASTTARNVSRATCQDDLDGVAKDGMMLIVSISIQPAIERYTHQL
jgi:hypothetical protein